MNSPAVKTAQGRQGERGRCRSRFSDAPESRLGRLENIRLTVADYAESYP